MRSLEYRCLECDYLFEGNPSPRHDDPLCPVCGSDPVRIPGRFEDERPSGRVQTQEEMFESANRRAKDP